MSQYTSYYLYQKYVKYGDQDWIPVYPTEYSISGDSSDPQVITKKQDNDPECGYTPPVIPQYRWVEDGDNYICDDCGYTPTPQYRTISGTPYCTGYDKMVDTQYQVSYDSGSTWSTVSSSTLTVEHNSEDCGYVPPTPPSSGYANQYLTFRALESGKFSFSESGMSYSLDSGSTWNTLTAWNTYNTPTVQSGSTIMWKATLSALSSHGSGLFTSTGQFEVEGNIMSLLYGDNFSGQTELNTNWAFYCLFIDCTGLTSAENLILPATTLSIYCYAGMFYNCLSLTTPPELPATALSYGCYSGMFEGCTSLTTAPALPATTLADYCYNGMFDQCTSLTTTPELPASTLSDGCYWGMFYGCSSLTSAPELPATALSYGCYRAMFVGCTSLATAPELPATTLAGECYHEMFQYCTSLTTAPVLSAATLVTQCYAAMFYNCTNLSSITCLATDISATDCTNSWVYGVAGSGTFTKAASMSNWPTGDNGIPSGWAVQDYQG